MTKWCLILIPLFALGCERTHEGVRCRVWGQNMIRYRDVEMLTIEYLNQGVDLRQFNAAAEICREGGSGLVQGYNLQRDDHHPK